MTSPAFTVPAGGQLSAQVNYDTEKSFDYSYVDVSVDGGDFTSIETSLSDPDDPNGVNEGDGISGKSDGWVPLTADLSAYAGQSVRVRFRQTNDENTHGFGFAVDSVSVGDALVEDVEDDAPDWTSDGFYVVTGDSYPVEYEHFYLAENRQYGGYDVTLQAGPVQLRLGRDEGGLGRAVPVPGRHARVVRQRLPVRQQHQPAPRCR